MSANIHYEVFVKKHKKAGWVLQQACEDRGEALDLAKQVQGHSKECSVRVAKETYDEANEMFHSVAIFTAGPENHVRKLRENNRMDPPCSVPTDLYTLHARRTLGRALGPWLKRQQISVIELLHRPDMAESLAAAGFDRQHAIQKVAIAQAGSQECSVQHVVLRLTELADKATDRLRKLDKARSLPGFQRDGYAATFAATSKHKEADFALRHALAEALIPMKQWPDKFSFLSSCVSDALVEGEGCDDSIWMLDDFISETAALTHALDALVGGSQMGDKLDRITDILLGQSPGGGTDGASLLAKAVSSSRLPKTQSVLAARVFRDLCGPRRLFPEDFDREIELNRTLAARLTSVDPSLAPADRLSEAFTIRSARLLENEAIQTLLNSCQKNAAEEMRRLLAFEESIVGTHNKTKLATFLRAVIGSHKTRNWFSYGPDKPLGRIAKLAHSQRSVAASKFDDNDKGELFAQLDVLCADVLADTKILDTLETRDRPSVENAHALMQLCENGIVTIGSSSDDICRRVLKLLRLPEVRSALQAGEQGTIDKAKEVGRMIERVRDAASQA